MSEPSSAQKHMNMCLDECNEPLIDESQRRVQAVWSGGTVAEVGTDDKF